jgi:hypothetical protein
VPTTDQSPNAARARLTRACRFGAIAGFIPYLAVLWDFGVRPLRTATASRINADFFDIQARALFHGNLDVPAGSLGIEAFVVDGRHYMYFPPFPALLRMPILLVTDRLDGRLTALSMVVGWVVLAFALTALIVRIRTTMRGDATVGRPEAVGFGLLVASVTGGSALVVIASQPWVYHEVYVWSTALAVGTLASLIAAWDDPSWRRLAITFGFGLATMLTRPPAGWALALAVAATGVWFLYSRRDRADSGSWRRAGRGLVGAGGLTLAIGSAINWAKFRHPYMFPIEDHVWSRFSAHRKVVLAFNDGRIDGPQFFWTNLVSYFRPDGVRFVPYFPFVTPPARPPTAVGDVLLDESFRTGSVPAFMPLLFALGLWGFVVALRPRGPAGIGALRIPLVGSLLMTGGVMGFGYIAPRYTSEFIPVLAVASVIGLADLARRMHGRSVAVRKVALGGVAAVAAYGMVANVAVGLVSERQGWRGGRLEQLVALQHGISQISGNPLDRRIREADELPIAGAADDLVIVGDCDALFVGTGETFSHWVPVQFRDNEFRIAVGDSGPRPGLVSMMWFSGYTLRQLHLQVGLDGQVRVVMIGTPPDTAGRWLEVEPGDVVEVIVRGDTAESTFVATAHVAGDDSATSVVDAPMTEWDQQYASVPITPHVALGSPVEAERSGLTITRVPSPELDLCNDLRS